jgi:GAF domain-containing protein
VDLAESINTLVEQLNQTLTELDQRVASRTSELEHHLNQLRVATEMAQDAASARGLDDLLYRSVNLIRDRFEFYYVSIFLLDDRSEYAILRAATGEAGRAMLESNLKIKVGEMDIVGQVSKTGQYRNNLIMETATIQMMNPTLPEARSEMGLPLKVGQRVIGVLDIQSREPSAFDEGDVNIIQTLADQLAVTIENVRLYKESQDNLHQLEAYYGRYSQEAWQRLGYFSSLIGYQYDRSGVKPIKQEEDVDTVTDEQTPSTQMISYPLQVRGQVIGNLDIWPNKEDWSPKDDTLIEAISERISQVMESARLFEETQARATREQTLNQIVSRFSRSLDLDTLLQTAVKELGKLPDVVEASIHISPTEMTHSGNGSKESPH